MRRRSDEVEEKNETLEFFMQIIRPDVYKEYKERKNSPQFESTSYKENMTEVEFNELSQIANDRMKLAKQVDIMPQSFAVTSPVETNTIVQPTIATIQHPRFDVKDPSTWVRPPNIPPMRKLDDPDTSNPITLK